MIVVRAKVQRGRLVLDEPTALPEGSELELVALESHEDDGLDAESRAALEASLEAAAEDLRDGRTRDAAAVFADLAARRR